MRKCAIALTCLAGLATSAIAADETRQGQFDPNGEFVPFVGEPGSLEFSGSLIVRVGRELDAHDEAEARAIMAAHGASHNAKVDYYVVDAPIARGRTGVGEAENAFSEALMATGLFAYAVPNWICYPLETPDDPRYGDQWHHPQMNSEAAWDVSQGDSEMILAFTDTGIYKEHPDFAGKVVNGYDAYNNQAEADGGDVSDIHGHGTHVAGCAAAVGNNAIGVAGVNWNAKIMMIRVAIDSSGGAYYEDLLEGAQWAIENGASIVSASYSGINHEPIQDMGEYIHSIGGIYMYAANNSNQNHSSFDWEDVVVVGATTYGDAKAGFSSYGRGVDLFAPGVDIGATTRDGGYGWWSGTSMATPVANGVAGLIWGIDPSLTPQEVEQILFETCHDLGADGEDDYWGWGRVDAQAAAEAAAAGSCIADWTGDGVVNTIDLIEFLNDWSDRDDRADIDGNGTIDTRDVLVFLNAWSAGC